MSDLTTGSTNVHPTKTIHSLMDAAAVVVVVDDVQLQNPSTSTDSGTASVEWLPIAP